MRVDVEHLARLAMLKLSESEAEEIRREIERVKEFVDAVLSAPVEGVDPLYHPTLSEGRVRGDEPAPSLPREEALANAAAVENGYVKAPRTITG